MPNTFAYIALYSWPLAVFILFRMMPRAQALIASILGGYLLLPVGVGIDLPMLPAFDKTLIPALSAAVMCILIPRAPGRRRNPEGTAASVRSTAFTQDHDVTARRPIKMRKRREVAAGGKLQATHGPVGRRIEMVLIVLLVFTPFLTVLHNAESYLAGPKFLPGLRIYDAFSMILSALITILPYWLARRYLADAHRHVLLLRGLCIAGILYSLPTLFEVRLSPQLSRWVYGFLAQSFGQAMRDGGFRPVVFLQHGLWLAIFLAMTALAAFALWRHERKGGRWLLAGVWLLGTLMLCHSLGAFAIAFLLLPIVLLMPVRIQMLVAVGFAVTILFYPMLRGAGLIPVDDITAIAKTISPERAQSLEFRLKNEDILLAHANAKPLAGWGGWGRSRVFDDSTGRDISVTDGMWIITVGVSGWFGYIAQFGLLTVPIILLTLYRRRLDLSLATSGLCLVLAANLIDMIPNATLTPVTWLIAGALMGHATTGGTAEPAAPRIARRGSRESLKRA